MERSKDGGLFQETSRAGIPVELNSEPTNQLTALRYRQEMTISDTTCQPSGTELGTGVAWYMNWGYVSLAQTNVEYICGAFGVIPLIEKDVNYDPT